VKNGWQLLHTSTCSSDLVEPISKVVLHEAHLTSPAGTWDGRSASCATPGRPSARFPAVVVGGAGGACKRQPQVRARATRPPGPRMRDPLLLAGLVLDVDGSVNLGEDRVVVAQPGVFAGLERSCRRCRTMIEPAVHELAVARASCRVAGRRCRGRSSNSSLPSL